MASLIAHLIDRVQQLADRVDSTYRPRCLNAIDEAQQWYAVSSPWDALYERETFLTSGSEALVLPDRVCKILRVADLDEMTPIDAGGNDWGEYATHLNKTKGLPFEWRPAGSASVLRQPEVPDYLVLTPSVSESFDVLMRGLVQDTGASGTALEFYEAQETINIASDSPVTSTTSWARIDNISKARATSADLKVDLAGGGTVSRIPSWGTRPLFQKIEFLFIPDGVKQVRVEYYRRPQRITDENQALDASVNEDVLAWRAAGNLHWMDQEGQAAQVAWAKADQLIAKEMSREETFGDRDHGVQPGFSYLEREDF